MVVGDAVYALTAGQQGARALKLGTDARRDGGGRHGAAQQHRPDREWRGGDRAVRPRAGAGDVPDAVRAGRRRGARAQAPDLRARRADAAAAALSAAGDARRGSTPIRRARREADADPFDFTGVDWLGRGREMSISVSPRSFLDMRAIAPSRARQAYLGLGENAVALTRPVAAVADECDWPIAMWQAPISADELRVAEARFGDAAGRPGHRRGVQRCGAAAEQRQPRPVSGAAFRHPRPGHRAAARLPAAAGAGHQLRARRVRTACSASARSSTSSSMPTW